MGWLSASLAALLVGPVLYQWAQARPKTLEWVEGFVVAAVAGQVLLDSLPHAFEAAGFLAVVVAGVGMFIPTLGERLLHDSLERAHTATVVLALGGIVAHGFSDGIALSLGTSSGLALAILLHRLPVGVMIWWLVRPSYGVVLAGAFLAGLMTSTVVGFTAAGELSATFSSSSTALIQAFVSGTLLHVLFHQHPRAGDAEPEGHPHTHDHSAIQEFQHWMTRHRLSGALLGFVSFLLIWL